MFWWFKSVLFMCFHDWTVYLVSLIFHFEFFQSAINFSVSNHFVGMIIIYYLFRLIWWAWLHIAKIIHICMSLLIWLIILVKIGIVIQLRRICGKGWESAFNIILIVVVFKIFNLQRLIFVILFAATKEPICWKLFNSLRKLFR